MNTIKIKRHIWPIILNRLKTRNKPSTFLIRERMKERLGFTVRDGRYYRDGNFLDEGIYLDFSNEELEMLFLMEFSELINE